MSKFLDDNGLLYLWQKITTKLGLKVDKVDGKGLSANDYTSEEKTKLAGIAAGANAYTHPAYTSKASGLYKVEVDTLGHVSAAAAVAKSDITALGIPAQDTTYAPATGSVNGLMSAADKTKLDGLDSGQGITVSDELILADNEWVTTSGDGGTYTPGTEHKAQYFTIPGVALGSGANEVIIEYVHSSVEMFNRIKLGTYNPGDGSKQLKLWISYIPAQFTPKTVAVRYYCHHWANATNTVSLIKRRLPAESDGVFTGGLMSMGDKAKLDGIDAITNAEIDVVVAS